MVIFFFFLALAGAIIIMFHTVIEINSLEKMTEKLTEDAGKYYEKIT